MALLVFDPVPLAPRDALNVSFLTARGAARPAGGVVGQWGRPLRLGSAGEVRDRRPHPGDFYWSWADVAGEFRRQLAALASGESSDGRDGSCDGRGGSCDGRGGESGGESDGESTNE